MTLNRLSADQVRRWNMMPQAMVRRSVAELSRRLRTQFEQECDDLDEFEAAFFSLDDRPFGLVHYKNEPADAVTIYVPQQIVGSREGASFVLSIVSSMDVPQDAIIWQETHAPAA